MKWIDSLIIRAIEKIMREAIRERIESTLYQNLVDLIRSSNKKLTDQAFIIQEQKLEISVLKQRLAHYVAGESK